MLVSHKKRFIFTKTAKTAGTSVEVYFEPYCLPAGGDWPPSETREQYEGPSGVVGFRGPGLEEARQRRWYNHMPAEIIRNQIGANVWNDYFKFCTIRDPFDMMVSAFHYTEHKNGCVNPVCDNMIERFRGWVASGAIVTNRPRFLIEGQPCIDYYIRYEELGAGIRHVCSVLDIPYDADKLPRINTGIRPGGRMLNEYFDERTVELVVNAYDFEFDHFGYPREVGSL